MRRGIETHGDEVSRRHRIAAFPGDLAFGAWSHHLASGGNDSVRQRWIEQLLVRYNTEGPELGDLRRRNGASATILKPDLLDRLRARLPEPPPDGGLWSSRKVIGLVDPSAPSEEPEIGFARRGRRIQKS